MDEDGPFDRALRRLRRDRAAVQAPPGPSLYASIAEEVLERLDVVRRDFVDALVLGSADGCVSESLRRRGLTVTSADAGFRFAAADRGVQCDEDRLPFGPERFDLAVFASGLDSVNDLPGALLLIRRALRPDGLFLAIFPGAGSLPRLRSAMFAADEAMGGAAPRVHPQIDVRAAGDLLGRAGFALPVAESHGVRLRYSDLFALVRDLRGLGATNILKARSRRPIGRAALAAAALDFASHAEVDGKVPEWLELISLTAWAPSPDQPRPARPGSASRSLADALRPPRRDEPSS